jgi:hypothetical protein
MSEIVVIGDLMLGRHIAPLIKRRGLKTHLAPLTEWAAGRPIVANLESPLFDGDVSPSGNGSPKFRAPTSLAKELAQTGIKAVSLGNNHILDCGVEGLNSTIRSLRDADIVFFGAGKSIDDACAPAVITVADKRVGLLGFTYREAATSETAGCAYLYDDTMASAIPDAQHDVDVLIAMPHAGIELLRFPLPRDQNAYRRMLDFGADIVIGSHPHCVQVRESYRGKPIYYSIGDALFDHHIDEIWERFWQKGSNTPEFVGHAERDLPTYSLALVIDINASPPKLTHHLWRLTAEGSIEPVTDDATRHWFEQFEADCQRFANDEQLVHELEAIETRLMAKLKKLPS